MTLIECAQLINAQPFSRVFSSPSVAARPNAALQPRLYLVTLSKRDAASFHNALIEALYTFEPARPLGRFQPITRRLVAWIRYEVHGYERVQAVVALLWPWLDLVRRQEAASALVSARVTWKPRGRPIRWNVGLDVASGLERVPRPQSVRVGASEVVSQRRRRLRGLSRVAGRPVAQGGNVARSHETGPATS